jgi:tape measure domain-containing protein
MNTADIHAKAGQTNDELKSLADRISDALHQGKFTAAELQSVLAERAKKAARKTDDLVHDFAWTAVGMGVGVGFLMGMLASRATQSPPEFETRRKGPVRERNDGATEEAGSSVWDKFQTILPLTVLALRTFQELRGPRR